MNDVPEPIARIWITYKTRIISEQRFNTYALISHLALSWYAFLSIVFAVYQSNFAQALGFTGANQASLVISVLTFGLSLVIYGFKFEDAARTHRECYLRMQSIYQSHGSEAVKLDEYRKLLEHYPNHSTSGYETLLFDAWKAGRVLSGIDGLPIKFSWMNVFTSYVRRYLWWLFLFLAFASPVMLGAFWLARA